MIGIKTEFNITQRRIIQMKPNKLKDALRQGNTMIGAFVVSGSPTMVEVLGITGFDFLIFDCEHSTTNFQTVEHMLRAAETVDITTMIRIPEISRTNILKALDIGVQGILVPMVNTAEQAREAVNLSKYPPYFPGGKRGVALRRAARYGASDPVNYFQQANSEIFVAIQCETKESVSNLDEILKVKGIDMVFIGPTDLSQSFGHPWEPGHPEVQYVIKQTIERTEHAGVISGVFATSPEDIKKYIEWGAKVIVCGADLSFLSKGAKQILEKIKDVF
jgi:2-keto-3-deoxy-L-rhamnonate aldolase RhmA